MCATFKINQIVYSDKSGSKEYFKCSFFNFVPRHILNKLGSLHNQHPVLSIEIAGNIRSFDLYVGMVLIAQHEDNKNNERWIWTEN